MEFKKSLKKFRLDNNLTQDELGQKLGLSGKVISKWESGYTMPDIEKIKMMCEIFNCDYADLIGPERKNKVKKEKVEEVKNEKFNINKNDSKILKTLSKILCFIVKLSRIFLFIGIVVMISLMIILPSFINKIEVHNSGLSYRDFKGDVYYVMRNNTSTSNDYVLKYNDRFIDTIELDVINKINNIFMNYSKNDIIFKIETIMSISVISLIVLIVTLYNFQMFLKNIHDNDTPFTKENIHYLGMTAFLLLAVYFCDIIVSLLINNLLDVDTNSLGLNKIIEIIFMLIMVYVFKYGYNMQKVTNGKIYEEIKN